MKLYIVSHRDIVLGVFKDYHSAFEFAKTCESKVCIETLTLV